ncbi:TonB-dependent receptor plug domain-containing protein [Candidatus Latescibacterota bacterium]
MKHCIAKIVYSALIILSIVFNSDARGDDLPVLEEVLITSSQPGRSLNSVGADITVLSREDFSKLNAETIFDVLETIASVDLVEKGTPGSQSDIAVNGSSIEGVLVLINGIRVHDPQTGHFAMDIPVDLSSVERIEVMDGGGSSIYGSSASGGVINIVTDRETEDVRSGFSIGSHNTGEYKVSLAKKILGSHVSMSLRSGRSDGYRESSDQKYEGGDMTGFFESEDWNVKWNAGFINKGFGAGNFYAPYPSYEKTITLQSGINAARVIDENRIIRFRAGSRGHGDNFLIKKEYLGITEDYRNTHYSRTYNFAAEYLSNSYDNIFYLIGAETERMGITSGSLGNHSDYNNSVYGEFSGEIKKAILSVSVRLDSGSMGKNIFSPGFGMIVPLSGKTRFRFRAERAFRSPTYTDLYYRSYSNMGNPLLKPEHSSSVNTGFDATGKNSDFGISVFARETTNAVDWVRDYNETVWTVANHGALSTNGVKVNYKYSKFKNWNTGLDAAILNQTVDNRKGMESKYTLNPLSKTISATVTGRLYADIKCSLVSRYEEPLRGGNRTPVSIKLSRNFGRFMAVFGVSNVFNERYEEIAGLPAHGRWFDLRMEYIISGQ